MREGICPLGNNLQCLANFRRSNGEKILQAGLILQKACYFITQNNPQCRSLSFILLVCGSMDRKLVDFRKIESGACSTKFHQGQTCSLSPTALMLQIDICSTHGLCHL